MQTVTPELFQEAVLPAVERGGSFQLTVTGSSMAPTLHPGKDAVLLTRAVTVGRGDILLFQRRDGSLILHRCIRIRGDRLTMNGDAQTWTEEISRSQVRARAQRLYRRGKWSRPSRLYALLWPLTRPIRPILIRLKHR